MTQVGESSTERNKRQANIVANVIEADLIAVNGVVHVIDNIL